MKKLSIPNHYLRLEGIAVLVASLVFYFNLGGKWPMLLILFLAPDIGILGYLVNNKVGSITYNKFHNYFFSILLISLGILYANDLSILLALIWAAHISFDRILGFGLKYQTGFKDTHMQKV